MNAARTIRLPTGMAMTFACTKPVEAAAPVTLRLTLRPATHDHELEAEDSPRPDPFSPAGEGLGER